MVAVGFNPRIGSETGPRRGATLERLNGKALRDFMRRCATRLSLLLIVPWAEAQYVFSGARPSSGAAALRGKVCLEFPKSSRARRGCGRRRPHSAKQIRSPRLPSNAALRHSFWREVAQEL